jgi:hypothetical protein
VIVAGGASDRMMDRIGFENTAPFTISSRSAIWGNSQLTHRSQHDTMAHRQTFARTLYAFAGDYATVRACPGAASQCREETLHSAQNPIPRPVRHHRP